MNSARPAPRSAGPCRSPAAGGPGIGGLRRSLTTRDRAALSFRRAAGARRRRHFVRDAVARGCHRRRSEPPRPWPRCPCCMSRTLASRCPRWPRGALPPHPRSVDARVHHRTNGKTTTSYLLARIRGRRPDCVRIVTVGTGSVHERSKLRARHQIAGFSADSRDMVSQGCGACVMEVSSHALALRVSSPAVGRGLFTNLTRDHLISPQHEEYFSPSGGLFQSCRGVPSVVTRGSAGRRCCRRREAPGHLRPRHACPVCGAGISQPRWTTRLRGAHAARYARDHFALFVRTLTHTSSPRPRRPRRSTAPIRVEHGIRTLSIARAASRSVGSRTMSRHRGYSHGRALKNLLDTALPLASAGHHRVRCGGDRDPPSAR